MNSYSFWLAQPRSAKLLYALLGALCFWLAFPPHNQVYLSFFFLVPLLLIEDDLFFGNRKDSGRRLWLWSSLQFFMLNFLCLWWIKNAAWIGAISSVIVNTLLMSLVFFFFHQMKKRAGERLAMLGLISMWIGYEYLHYEWDFDFPWLTLGNMFANTPELVQWYDKTGVFGGSLWVLLLNFALFYALKHTLLRRNPALDPEEKRWFGWSALRYYVRFFVLLSVPAIWSYSSYSSYQSKGVIAEVAVIQPNYDPYSLKFDDALYGRQLDTLLLLSDRAMTPETRLVLWPETSVPGNLWLNEGDKNWQQSTIKSFLSNYEGPAFLVGASAVTYFEQGEKLPDVARPHPNGGYYLPYNSALLYRNGAEPLVYHKSRLVAGVEKLPYPKVMGFLTSFSIDLGGMSGTLGTQPDRAVFRHAGIAAAPVICYESVFGGYLTQYVRNGANLITIITNDGWWGDTDGYKQHLAFARLRAIENRRDIARSANTGISGFINQRGDVVAATGWWEQTSMTAQVHLNEETTFYTRYGDYLGRTAAFLAILLYLISFTRSKSKKTRLK